MFYWNSPGAFEDVAGRLFEMGLDVIRFFSEHGAHFEVEQTWSDGTHRFPQNEDECCEVLRRFIDINFDDADHARQHVDDELCLHRAGAEAAHRAQRSRQAQSILEHYERTTQLTDRVDRIVTRALDSYPQAHRRSPQRRQQ